MGVEVIDLGRVGYQDAYARQNAEHQRVLDAREDGGLQGELRGVVLIVEHEPVITVSQRADAPGHVLMSKDVLARMGVDVQPTDRGGDVTYHGPGQIVLYPIVDLNHFGLRLHDYMRLLEQAVIETLAHFDLVGHRDSTATGVWVMPSAGEAMDTARAAKIAAMGVRVRRWISMHGLALNVAVNLRHFDLIVPCGLTGRAVTSMDKLITAAPSFAEVQGVLVMCLLRGLERARANRRDVQPG